MLLVLSEPTPSSTPTSQLPLVATSHSTKYVHSGTNLYALGPLARPSTTNAWHCTSLLNTLSAGRGCTSAALRAEATGLSPLGATECQEATSPPRGNQAGAHEAPALLCIKSFWARASNIFSPQRSSSTEEGRALSVSPTDGPGANGCQDAISPPRGIQPGAHEAPALAIQGRPTYPTALATPGRPTAMMHDACASHRNDSGKSTLIHVPY